MIGETLFSEAKTMRSTIYLALVLLAFATVQACRPGETAQEDVQTAVVVALNSLVAELAADRPADAAAYTERLRAYLEAHPAFYGAAAALLDEAGDVTAALTSIVPPMATARSILPSPTTTSRSRSG